MEGEVPFRGRNIKEFRDMFYNHCIVIQLLPTLQVCLETAVLNPWVVKAPVSFCPWGWGGSLPPVAAPTLPQTCNTHGSSLQISSVLL